MAIEILGVDDSKPACMSSAMPNPDCQ